MKRITVILLASLIALLATGAVEVLKVPQLVKHFAQHLQNDPDTTLVDFLVEHYSGIPHTDNDDSEDRKLPFKTSEYTAGVITCFFVPQTAVPVKRAVYVPRPAPRYRFSCTPSEFAHSIWQPPKNA